MQPGTLKAIAALCEADLISNEDADFLGQQYRFLRSVESGLRLMNTTARHDLPDDKGQLERLAYLLDYPGGKALADKVRQCRESVRARVAELFGETA